MKIFVILLFFLLSFQVLSSSRVIRDNRLDDLGVSPTLGRGYSLATNTYQSLCMNKIDVTTPSYDMKYKYVEIERDWEQSFSTTIDVNKKLSFLFLKSNVNVHSEVSGETTYHYHYIFASIKVDSYYNSLNEGTSTLSDSAKNLLVNGDVIGFFDACGPYYIRSIGRHSSFLALLRYRTIETERDVNFEIKLKNKLRGFFAGGSSNTTVSTEFHSETQDKRLSIAIWAYGLGKDHLADLIPTDINSFKKVIQDAIKAMQDASSGRITSMEVVPWIENTEFQNSLKLESVDDILQYEEKKNLEANAELIAEFDRIDRAQMDQYYKASNCRRILSEEYLELSGDYEYEPEYTLFKDVISPGQQSKNITLAHFDSILSESTVSNYLEANNSFLYGGASENPGAIFCMNELYRQGIKNVHFRNIPACISARAWSVPIAPVLDHYCMPEFAKVITPTL